MDARPPAAVAHHALVIWRVEVDRPATAEAWSRLCDDECRRARRFRAVLHQQRWIWAHAALRDILAYHLGDDAAVSFRYGPFGKPYLVEGSDVHFNLSHSGKWALIAVSEGAEVGVDLENVRRPDDLPAV